MGSFLGLTREEDPASALLQSRVQLVLVGPPRRDAGGTCAAAPGHGGQARRPRTPSGPPHAEVACVLCPNGPGSAASAPELALDSRTKTERTVRDLAAQWSDEECLPLILRVTAHADGRPAIRVAQGSEGRLPAHREGEGGPRSWEVSVLGNRRRRSPRQVVLWRGGHSGAIHRTCVHDLPCLARLRGRSRGAGALRDAEGTVTEERCALRS